MPFIINDNFTIQGHVDINVMIENSASITNVTLHIKDIDIVENSVQIDGYDVVGHGYDSPREFYIIYVNETEKRSKNTKISMDFTSNLSD